jgi:hypothetical protein
MNLQLITITLILEALDLNFENPEPPKNFPEVGFLQQFSEPLENFPEPLRSVLPEKHGCVALGVWVEAWQFPSSSLMLQIGLSPMAKHLIG